MFSVEFMASVYAAVYGHYNNITFNKKYKNGEDQDVNETLSIKQLILAFLLGYAFSCGHQNHTFTFTKVENRKYRIVNETTSEIVTTTNFESALKLSFAFIYGRTFAKDYANNKSLLNTENAVKNLSKGIHIIECCTSKLFHSSQNYEFEDLIAEDGFVTLYRKNGSPYTFFLDDLTKEEIAELKKNPVVGGRYDYVKFCTDGSIYDVHHILSAEAIKKTGFLSYNTGPCIRILKCDHAKTKSYGNYKSAESYRMNQIDLIKKGKIREVIQEEIDAIRFEFGSKYDREIEEMLKYVAQLESNNWEINK